MRVPISIKLHNGVNLFTGFSTSFLNSQKWVKNLFKTKNSYQIYLIIQHSAI